MVEDILKALSIGIITFYLVKFVSFLLQPYTSPLRDVPGPPSSSWFLGNINNILNSQPAVLQEAWTDKYGKTIHYKGWFNRDRLYTLDTRALGHILNHSNDYFKPELARHTLSSILGEGLVVAEGEQHRRQASFMNPAFGPTQIRELTDIFVDKAIQLRDVWNCMIQEDNQPARIEVLSGLSKMTLDVIGLAGFNHQFHSLESDGSDDELGKALRVMLRSTSGWNVWLPALAYFFPPLRLLSHMSDGAHARKVMTRIGLELVREKKIQITKAALEASKDGAQERLHGRDLLTILVKANMASDITESQRMSDEDVLAPGYETTSVATTWCLFSLSQAPEAQQKLREELLAMSTDTPSVDDLTALPYLDAVIRETLRLHPPIHTSIRVAEKDDVIPLDTLYVDAKGRTHDYVRVTKGTIIDVPIVALNRSKELWGDDAHEFKYESVPAAIHAVPGIWSNTMAFLGGQHACIGYRFALNEMKALLFVLIRAFEFQLAVPPAKITSSVRTMIQRPVVCDEVEKHSQLPMLVKRYVGS
ncbi:hypothetical protein POSPLADRAFT_1046615 [Postia placenta MAD-698-R-SB12]|uniref:Cytochrome P450 n=1 Tax=Postia placenta MAD-698-R-SB12 TaxID=670580 RepID=A0A1X6N1B0_9APHY|nr:hypothetical protein POSPLADRAFT_1046615 [Postia placenta MAD-698-R-SB12]OSX62243.1 hypothetical protein POSPLADRAFT_1046615 [Postia placenta MAD-698-R-SB12]